MSTCPSCQHPATKRDGYDALGRQRYHCRPCPQDFTSPSASAFSGYRWPADVILMAVRWYCSLPLSAAQGVRLLAERKSDVTARTVLNWGQTFGPQLAAALRKPRRRVGRKWRVDEVFCFRGQQKLYLYRAVDEHGQGIDVLRRGKRDQASAEAVFRQALARAEVTPNAVITDHHQPYGKAVAAVVPLARHVRTGLHRRRGYTTQPIERSHVPPRDRLRGARGLRTVHTGQRFLESFEALYALRRGTVKLRTLVPRYRPTLASVHEAARAVVAARDVLGMQLKKAAGGIRRPISHSDTSFLVPSSRNTKQFRELQCFC
jgi:transposase, IS6 family